MRMETKRLLFVNEWRMDFIAYLDKKKCCVVGKNKKKGKKKIEIQKQKHAPAYA